MYVATVCTVFIYIGSFVLVISKKLNVQSVQLLFCYPRLILPSASADASADMYNYPYICYHPSATRVPSRASLIFSRGQVQNKFGSHLVTISLIVWDGSMGLVLDGDTIGEYIPLNLVCRVSALPPSWQAVC